MGFASPPAVAALGDEFAIITASDAGKEDNFGISVGVSGTTAIVGATGNDDNGMDSGSSYLLDITTRRQLAKLKPTDGAAFDRFGSSVAISGTTAIVGSPGDDDNGRISGSAYMFDIATGMQLAKLKPGDGAAFDRFGSSLAISGTTAIIGALTDDVNGERSGSAYLFNVVTGDELAKLTPNDGAADDYFGWSVDINASRAIVGAPNADDNGRDSGGAYVFDSNTGTQLFKLAPGDGASFDHFGFSVASSGNTIVVGAPGDDDNGFNSGSAYLFDVISGSQLAKLTPSDGALLDVFGGAVDIVGTTVVVGASVAEESATDSGRIYLFDATIPEPSALLLAVVAIMGLLAGKRH